MNDRTAIAHIPRLVGVGRSTVYRWVAEGRLVVDRGRVSVEEVAALRDLMRARRGDSPPRRHLP